MPLSVTVNLGGRAGPSVAPAPPTPHLARSADDTELQEALEELAAARARPYYDADADRAAAADYYGEIPADLPAQLLFERLSGLVRSTHERTFNYRPSRHVYPWVDLHPDLSIRSIYSGKGFDPEELIREDFRIDQRRSARLRELMLREASISQERMEREIDLLEASLPYNCEHVVPQSWYQKREPMRGDLHHLFACEPGCNSFRSNIPYYDFPDFEEAVRDACGKRLGEDKFEPASGKGAVARATLYFLLRYPGQVGDESRELQRGRIPTLLVWHEQFPPDAYERHRNMAVFAMQGNRNPLIDHPEWAGQVDFTLGIG
jgi:endonuclease I